MQKNNGIVISYLILNKKWIHTDGVHHVKNSYTGVNSAIIFHNPNQSIKQCFKSHTKFIGGSNRRIMAFFINVTLKMTFLDLACS